MRVLVVEDEPYLAEALGTALRREAFAVDVVLDGEQALGSLDDGDHDVVVLDRDLPGISGDDVARHLPAGPSTCRVLMLTAADRLDDKVSGFELGADDYLTEPFAVRELVVRLRALARRPVEAAPPS